MPKAIRKIALSVALVLIVSIYSTVAPGQSGKTSQGDKNAGQKYAADLDLKDFRVSPVYGNLTGLCRISLFTGTRDLLNADAQKFKQRMKEQKISFNYFEYPDMFHDWVIITSLKESLDVIDKVDKLVNDYV